MRLGLGAIALFAALPVLRLKAVNAGEPLPLTRLGFYSLVVFIVLAAISLAVGRSARSIGQRTAAFLALALYILGELAMTTSQALDVHDSTGTVLLITSALLISGWLITRWRSTLTYVWMFGMVLVLWSVVSIAVGGGQPASAVVAGSVEEPWPLTNLRSANIYWFVLDGYGNRAVLEKYGYNDFNDFERALEDRGFSVSSTTVAAYPMSFLSIASTLSGDYIAQEGDDIVERTEFYRRIQGNNRVVSTLRSWGYTYLLAPANKWAGSQCSGWEDACINPSLTTEADWVLLQRTPIAGVLQGRRAAAANAQRSDPVRVVDKVLESPSREPRFVFIHLMNPHPPYYMSGPNCTLQDLEFDLRSSWGPKKDYVEAVRCLNGRLLVAVDRILELDPSAVIILQGDHGPDPGITWAVEGEDSLSGWTPSDVETRLAAFNSIRIPGGCAHQSPVALPNTFRFVLSCLAHERLQVLPARTWIGNVDPGHLREVAPPDYAAYHRDRRNTS